MMKTTLKKIFDSLDDIQFRLGNETEIYLNGKEMLGVVVIALMVIGTIVLLNVIF